MYNVLLLIYPLIITVRFCDNSFVHNFGKRQLDVAIFSCLFCKHLIKLYIVSMQSFKVKDQIH